MLYLRDMAGKKWTIEFVAEDLSVNIIRERNLFRIFRKAQTEPARIAYS